MNELNATSIDSYRIADFKEKYPRYCELAKLLRCNPAYSSRTYIGGLNSGLHPLGFALRNPSDLPCDTPTAQYCAFTNWTDARQKLQWEYGSRAFLIRNLTIRD